MKQESATDVIAGIAKIRARVLGAVLALVFGLGMFVVTAWLVVKGGPNPGAHLQLLGNYFIGYSVTWLGCFVGFFYGALLGWAIGWSTGVIYNRLVAVRSADS